MKIGDLVRIVPSNNVSGCTARYVRPLLKKVGIIINTGKAMGHLFASEEYLVFIEEKRYLIPKPNLRLINPSSYSNND